MEENWLCKRKIKEREEWAIAHFQLSITTEKVVSCRDRESLVATGSRARLRHASDFRVV